MSDDTYAGGSDAKDIARAAFWASAPMPTPERPAIVLASREGGDIDVLHRLGATPGAIIAVDREMAAISECQQRHAGKAIFVLGDVHEVITSMKLKPSTVFLDFCSQIQESVVRSLVVAANAGADFLGIVVMLGRENPWTQFRLCSFDDLCKYQWEALGAERSVSNRRHRLAAKKNYRCLLLQAIREHTGGTWLGIEVKNGDVWFNPNAGLRHHVPDAEFNSDEHVALSARREMLTTALMAAKTTRIPYSELSMQYVGHKAPMGLFSFVMGPWSELAVDRAVWARIRKGEEAEARRELSILGTGSQFFDRDAFLVALGIPKETVSAWRAHQTRGSYAAKEVSRSSAGLRNRMSVAP